MNNFTNSTTTYSSVVPFYSFSLCVGLWLGLFVIQLLFLEFNISYFSTIPILLSLSVSLAGVLARRQTSSRNIAGWALILSFIIYAIFSHPSIIHMFCSLIIGLMFGRCILPKEAIIKIWLIGIGVLLIPLIETIQVNFSTFLAVIGIVLPAIFIYSIMALLMYIEATDNQDMINWALNSQQKDAHRANIFFEQRQQLQQTIKREEYQSWHLAVLNAELDEARHAAEVANRMKTQLIANINHELRTPLNIILSYSHIILNAHNYYNITLPDPLKQDIQHLQHTAQHLISLVNDLLDLSQVEINPKVLQIEPLAIKPILIELHDISSRVLSVSPSVVWKLNLPEQIPTVSVDPVRLRQMVYNLLSNAAKFTKSGSIELGVEIGERTIGIYVKDTGIGIPDDIQEQIFMPFFKYHQEVNGIGLGLHIVQKLVALHGGKITVESQLGVGSTFWIHLPVANIRPQQTTTTLRTPALIVVSGRDPMSDDVRQIGLQREISLYRLTQLESVEDLLINVYPVGVIWDIKHSGEAEWKLFQELKKHPAFVSLPTYVTQNIMNQQGVYLVDELSAKSEYQPIPLILVIEDDLQAQLAMQRLLLKHFSQYLVHLTSSGQEALTFIQSRTPALIILDILLPDIDGWQILNTLRQSPEGRTVPVLVLSGKKLLDNDLKHLAGVGPVVLHMKGVLRPDELVHQISALLTGKLEQAEQTSQIVKQVIALIHSRYHEDLSRDELAHTVGVTERYLSYIFKQEMGISPWTYLKRLRLVYAKQLLAYTDKPISFIAYNVGFRDAKYFSRVFHEEEGVSPKYYREHHLK